MVQRSDDDDDDDDHGHGGHIHTSNKRTRKRYDKETIRKLHKRKKNVQEEEERDSDHGTGRQLRKRRRRHGQRNQGRGNQSHARDDDDDDDNDNDNNTNGDGREAQTKSSECMKRKLEQLMKRKDRNREKVQKKTDVMTSTKAAAAKKRRTPTATEQTTTSTSSAQKKTTPTTPATPTPPTATTTTRRRTTTRRTTMKKKEEKKKKSENDKNMLNSMALEHFSVAGHVTCDFHNIRTRVERDDEHADVPGAGGESGNVGGKVNFDRKFANLQTQEKNAAAHGRPTSSPSTTPPIPVSLNRDTAASDVVHGIHRGGAGGDAAKKCSGNGDGNDGDAPAAMHVNPIANDGDNIGSDEEQADGRTGTGEETSLFTREVSNNHASALSEKDYRQLLTRNQALQAALRAANANLDAMATSYKQARKDVHANMRTRGATDGTRRVYESGWMTRAKSAMKVVKRSTGADTNDLEVVDLLHALHGVSRFSAIDTATGRLLFPEPNADMRRTFDQYWERRVKAAGGHRCTDATNRGNDAAAAAGGGGRGGTTTSTTVTEEMTVTEENYDTDDGKDSDDNGRPPMVTNHKSPRASDDADGLVWRAVDIQRLHVAVLCEMRAGLSLATLRKSGISSALWDESLHKKIQRIETMPMRELLNPKCGAEATIDWPCLARRHMRGVMQADECKERWESVERVKVLAENTGKTIRKEAGTAKKAGKQKKKTSKNIRSRTAEEAGTLASSAPLPTTTSSRSKRSVTARLSDAQAATFNKFIKSRPQPMGCEAWHEVAQKIGAHVSTCIRHIAHRDSDAYSKSHSQGKHERKFQTRAYNPYRQSQSLNQNFVSGAWSEYEHALLCAAREVFGDDFRLASECVISRNYDQCRKMAVEVDANTHLDLTKKKFKWTKAMDRKLLALYEQLGKKWIVIAKALGVSNDACRHRYMKLFGSGR